MGSERRRVALCVWLCCVCGVLSLHCAAGAELTSEELWGRLGYSVYESRLDVEECDKPCVLRATAAAEDPPANMQVGEAHYWGARAGLERHGLGVFRIAVREGVDGELEYDEYVGNFRRDLKHGFGIATSAEERAVYSGEFWNDEQHGRGLLRVSTREYYDGEWKFGLQDGRGVYVWPTGARYQGEWAKGDPHGYGVMDYPKTEGMRYEGEWVRGVRQGQGHLIRLADGAVMTATWENDQPLKGPQMDQAESK